MYLPMCWDGGKRCTPLHHPHGASLFPITVCPRPGGLRCIRLRVGTRGSIVPPCVTLPLGTGRLYPPKRSIPDREGSGVSAAPSEKVVQHCTPPSPHSGGYTRVPPVWGTTLWGIGTPGCRVVQGGTTLPPVFRQWWMHPSPPGLVQTFLGDRDTQREGGVGGTPLPSVCTQRRIHPSIPGRV